MRLGPAANVARVNIAEIITALWQFAHAQGLLTDDIGERTTAAGVLIDGLLVRDAGIPEAAVVEHEAALMIAGSQIPSLPEALVTAHEAALAILETQITDGSLLARLAAAETVAGAWTFTAAATFQALILAQLGITLSADQFLTLSGSGRIEAIALSLGTNIAARFGVSGDATDRFRFAADGLHEWSAGTGAHDTNLFRAAANELATDDDLNVGGALDLGGDIEYSERSPAQITSNQANLATGTETVQRIDTDAPRNISGFAGGRAGRVIVIVYIGGNEVVLLNQDAGSTAANRMMLPNNTSLSLTETEAVTLWYDNTMSRWRAIGAAA